MGDQRLSCSYFQFPDVELMMLSLLTLKYSNVLRGLPTWGDTLDLGRGRREAVDMRLAPQFQKRWMKARPSSSLSTGSSATPAIIAMLDERF